MITMKELGNLAGVSQSTISIVLNHKAKQYGISEETQKRIHALAHQHGFRPNMMARSMRVGRTGIVGLLVHEGAMRQSFDQQGNENSYMRLQAAFLLAGYKIMLEVVTDEDIRTLTIPKFVSDGLADFLILMENFVDSTRSTNYIAALHRFLPRLMLYDDCCDLPDIPTLSRDNAEAAIIAADHLWERGYRSFGILCDASFRLAHSLRAKAFQTRIAELSGGASPVELVTAGDRWTLNCGGLAVTELLERMQGKLPDALFCTNDYFAYGAEQELLQRGYSIPKDTALIGVGEWGMSEQAQIPITTVSQDVKERIEAAVKRWKDIQAGVALSEKIPPLPSRLQVRAST
ncbi:MAG: LacI family DNA-binding transcriptional regulator [Victivallales bacterium]|nr:LacI family DNA-binding transcriptional regulator [Victivallales bacterium]